MSSKTAAVTVQGPQLEEIQELNMMKENQELSDVQQILAILQANPLSLEVVGELKEMIQKLPEAIEEKTKALLKPAEAKSETYQITKQNQEIAKEQLEIAKANNETLKKSLELHEKSVTAQNQQTQIMAENKQELSRLASLVGQLTGCPPLPTPSSESDSSES
jgi:hypothetical protein